MKKYVIILMALLPLALTAQVTPLTAIASAQRADGKIGLSEMLNEYSEDTQYSFFDVNEEMFKAFCELDYADSTTIALFKKIKSVKMLEKLRTQEEMEEMGSGEPSEEPVDSDFYNQITGRLDITGYNQLLKSRNNTTIALFLKKENGPNDNEFLLITNRLVIDIRGDIKIKTIYQMEEMMSYVTQILPN